MSDYNLNKLIEFIKKETMIYDEVISLDTVIESGLGVTGDDAEPFISSFSKEFNIDISSFKIEQHFKGEGNKTIKNILNFFRKEKDEIIYRPLIVKDLLNAIISGKLDSEMIE